MFSAVFRRAPVLPEAVLFDAGLTLIRTASTTAQVAEPVLARSGVPFTPDSLRRAMTAADARVEAQWTQGDWFASERTVRLLFVSAYRAALAELPGVVGDADLAAHLADSIYDSYNDTQHWTLYPDVLPTLEALRGAGVQMGVVSDWGHGLEAIALELELGRYLRFMVVSSRFGLTKPDPAVFAMALERIGVRATDAVYVGDTYVKDVLGARAAGIQPVLLDRAGAAPDVDCPVVSTLTEVLPLIGLDAPF